MYFAALVLGWEVVHLSMTWTSLIFSHEYDEVFYNLVIEGEIRGNLHMSLRLNKSPSLLNGRLELKRASFQKILLFRRQFS